MSRGPGPRPQRDRRWTGWLPLGVVAALLVGAQFLPPDTALKQMRAQGLMRVCLIPSAAAPWATGDPARPGLDIALLDAIAGRLGVRLAPVAPAAGSPADFNPQSWRINRARCEVVAGGILDSDSLRRFLDPSDAYAESGWAMTGPAAEAGLAGARAGVLLAAEGLDRLALSRQLRAAGARATPFTDAAELQQALVDGQVTLAIGDAAQIEAMAGAGGWPTAPVPGLPPRQAVVFGLWKGDLTLKRAVNGALRAMARDGSLAALRAEYLGGPPPPRGSS